MKKVAIFCPFYVTPNNKGTWIDSWINTINAHENTYDLFYSISYPSFSEKWDVDGSSKNVLDMTDIRLLHQISIKNATNIFIKPNIEHASALSMAHRTLKELGYDYMIHIEQDVIISKPFVTSLVDACYANKSDIAITDITRSNGIDIDISVFCINLNITTDLNDIYGISYIDDINYTKNELIHGINKSNILYKNKLLQDYSLDELHEMYSELFTSIYDENLYTQYKSWVMTLAKAFKSHNNPIFFDLMRGYILHCYKNNKISIIKNFTDAIHVGESRSLSQTDDNTTPLNKYMWYTPPKIHITKQDAPQAPFMTSRIRPSTDIKPINIVIISKNQENTLHIMVNALKKSFPTFKRIFVLDRCTDNSESVLTDLNEHYIKNDIGIGFCAGTARSLGAQHTDPYSDILFLDGDRIPSNINEQLVYNALHLYDITLIKGEIEPRKWFSDDFTYNPNYGLADSHVWTCGFAIRREAVQVITKINHNTLFNNLFDGEYGWEDLHLGDVAYHCGLTCGGFPKSSYVEGELSLVYLDDKPRYLEQNRLRMSMREFLRHRMEKYSHRINDRPDIGKLTSINPYNELLSKNDVFIESNDYKAKIPRPNQLSKQERRDEIKKLLTNARK